MQGYTEAPWRRFHAEVYGPDSGSADCYFTPFVRLEGGIPRSRDMRDITYGPGREKTFTGPQIIFRDISEFSILTDAVASAGYKRIDLNMGCPFVPQMKKGRGAAFPANIDNLHDIASAITNIGERISFSVKMRLGTDSPKLWRHTIEILNTVPLSHICVHPRTARQAYSGNLYLAEFGELLEISTHPIVFNGDILTPSDIDSTISRFPKIAGVMAGRGLLGRPSLIAEWREGREWNRQNRIEHILALHDLIYMHYSASLCGDAQILSKIKSFWDYLEPETGHRASKAIRKASNIKAYHAAIGMIAERR